MIGAGLLFYLLYESVGDLADPKASYSGTEVFGIGRVVAEAIAAFFRDEHTRDTLHRLVDAGASAEAPAPSAAWNRRRSGRRQRGAARSRPSRSTDRLHLGHHPRPM